MGTAPRIDGSGEPVVDCRPWTKPEATPVVTVTEPAVVDVLAPGIYVNGVRQPDPQPTVEVT